MPDQGIAADARAALRRLAMPSPVQARHREYSLLLSADDEVAVPSERLLDVALAAVEAARGVSLGRLSGRLSGEPDWPSIWPGEHYKLLAGLVQVMQPSVVIEIGTATGLSALAMLERLPPGGRLVTYDLVAWRDYQGAVLTEDDFSDGRFEQRLDDLSESGDLDRNRELLAGADLIFVDAAKDGVQERRFLENFESIEFRRPPIVVFDDVRLWNMLEIWRGITRPKLDLTSFGHWTGTGLVDFG